MNDQDALVGRGLRTLANGLDHPEGVCWSPAGDAVYAGGEAGQLYRFDLAGGQVETVATVPGGFLLGMALDAGGNVYACDPNSGYVQRISPAGRIERYGDRIGYPNYPVFDRDGNLWVTDSGAWDEVSGGLVRIAPGGATERVAGPFRFANGLAIRGEHLYMVESQMPGVVRLPLSGGPAEAVVELPRTVPDGLAFDAEGGLWIGCYQPNRIYRRDPGGDLETVVDDWTGEYVMTPTNLAFAGADLGELVAPGVAMIDTAETVRMAPILAEDAVFGALLQPDAYQVDTVGVMEALTGELRGAGVDVRTGVAAEGAIVEGGRVRGVRTSDGPIAADAVVNAAGAAARALGARDGVDIAAVPLLESRFTTEPIAGVTDDLPMMLFFERDLLYLREQAGGLLVGAIEGAIGGRSRVDLDAPPRTVELSDHAAREHEQLARDLAGVIPVLACARVRERASGLPTWTPDGRHILGFAPGIDGYVVLAGCNESCVTHGPGLARIAAELVTTGTSAADISAYRVERFGALETDAVQAAAERQYLLRHPPAEGVAATPFGIELP